MASNIGGDILGLDEMQRKLSHLRTTAARRIMATGSAESAKELAKRIKAEVPSNAKSVKRAIGWRRLKVAEAKGGGAKVGGKVGSAAKYKGKGPSGKGVGISGANVHWWLAGTAERRTGKSGGPIRRTGAMPPQIDPVWIIAIRNKQKLMSLWGAGAKKQFKKEVEKGKAFA